MKRYYYISPRGFGNEFSVVSVDLQNPHEIAQFGTYYERYLHSSNPNWDVHRLTAKRAREIVADERRQRRCYDRAGLHNEIVGATEIITATEFFAPY